MKKLLLLLVVTAFAMGARAQDIKPYTLDDLFHRVGADNTATGDTIYVINFWSTFCAPCVGELHEFNTLEKKFAGQPLKVILVSLDFKDDMEKGKLEGFVQRKRLTPECVWLNERDPNEFIPRVDQGWQGSIPATLMLYPAKKQRQFMEGTITANKLKNIADKWRQ